MCVQGTCCARTGLRPHRNLAAVQMKTRKGAGDCRGRAEVVEKGREDEGERLIGEGGGGDGVNGNTDQRGFRVVKALLCVCVCVCLLKKTAWHVHGVLKGPSRPHFCAVFLYASSC